MSAQSPDRASSTSRRVGYAVAVVVNAVLLALINVAPGWQVLPFLTDAFTEVLPLVNLSLGASLLVNVVYLGFDRRWFRAMCEAALAAISLAVSIRMLRVFPFDFSAYAFDWALLTRIVLWVAILGSAVAVVVWVVQLLRAVVAPASRP